MLKLQLKLMLCPCSQDDDDDDGFCDIPVPSSPAPPPPNQSQQGPCIRRNMKDDPLVQRTQALSSQRSASAQSSSTGIAVTYEDLKEQKAERDSGRFTWNDTNDENYEDSLKYELLHDDVTVSVCVHDDATVSYVKVPLPATITITRHYNNTFLSHSTYVHHFVLTHFV